MNPENPSEVKFHNKTEELNTIEKTDDFTENSRELGTGVNIDTLPLWGLGCITPYRESIGLRKG